MWVTGQNGIGQNGVDKMVAISIDFNSIEFMFRNHKSQISNKPKWVKMEARLMKKIILSVGAGLLD